MRSAMILLSFAAAACQVSEPAPETTPGKEPATAPLVQRLPSAYGALRELLGVVERTGSVVLRRIECETVGGPGTAKGQFRAKLDLAVAGSDSIEATRAFNRFEKEIRANAWCLEFQAASTKVLPEDRGIVSDGVVILVDASAIPAGAGERAAASPEADAVLVHAREAAARSKVGQIDCSMRRVSPERGVEEIVYRFRPTAKEASFELDDLRRFFRELDALAGGEITSIDLVPAKKQTPGTEPVETWTFQVELTSRAG